jgi:predicted DNA binding CopG/RHH family protein
VRRLTEQINLKLTRDELAALKRAAEQHGLNAQQYLRTIVAREMRAKRGTAS